MASSKNAQSTMAYRPTSLDFINLPNPIEPHAVPEKHPLNDTQRLEGASHPEFLRLLLEQAANSNVERPAKRRKSGDAKLLDLPKLPAVKSGAKRLRIPPTLSGLHQPPPDAGLLPSISVDQPINIPARNLAADSQASSEPKAASTNPSTQVTSDKDGVSTKNTTPAKQKRNKWAEDETRSLLKGVAKFGIGNWTQILNCPDYQFNGRTAIDLKDRFRVCCPDEYKSSRPPKNAKEANGQERVDDSNAAPPKVRRPNRSDRKSSSQLQQLGINEPFQRSGRRRRTDYTSAEDEALLLGFKKHGNSWAIIRQDPDLNLAHRRATDLRDRFRTKYPEQYEKVGLAPRKEPEAKKASATSVESNEAGRSKVETATNPKSTSTDIGMESPHTSRTEKENKAPAMTAPPKKQPVASLLHFDPDAFWGAPFDEDETEPERLTLDRRILDWPSETIKPSGSDNARYDADPLGSYNQKHLFATSQSSAPTGKGSGDVLPSLADITAGVDDLAEHFELPSLMGVFGALDGDGRTLPSLEELWK